MVIPLQLIAIGFGAIMMILIRIWTISAPSEERKIPEYSLHVMYEPPSKQTQKALYGESGTAYELKHRPPNYSAFPTKPANPSLVPYGYIQAQERAASPAHFDTSYGSLRMMGADVDDTSMAYAEKSRII